MDTEKATIIPASEGKSISVVGDTYRIVMTGEQTGNAFAVIDMLIPPGGGPGPHAHASFQESFYVMDGEVVVKTKGQSYTARKGDFVRIPLGGIAHDFKNETDTPAHLLCILVPSGLEKFFEEIGKPVEFGSFLPAPTLTLDDQKQLSAVAEKYGQQVFPPDYLD
jgi:quercetin dioxygenase-like cupin family protein